ncbi:hypothetical protein GPB2148_505 [marine gamma proteobacterium HTCC2148]|nr:hypothetical protein GPB2148_505 [marine gamma proteobacterium HTCC2148]
MELSVFLELRILTQCRALLSAQRFTRIAALTHRGRSPQFDTKQAADGQTAYT